MKSNTNARAESGGGVAVQRMVRRQPYTITRRNFLGLMSVAAGAIAAAQYVHLAPESVVLRENSRIGCEAMDSIFYNDKICVVQRHRVTNIFAGQFCSVISRQHANMAAIEWAMSSNN